jgi:predicted transposase/invertase (TIGR01784 family)
MPATAIIIRQKQVYFNPMTLPHHPHYRFFKDLFSRRNAAEDFIRHYLPTEIIEWLVQEFLVICKDSFIDEALAGHYTDLLYQITLKSQQNAYIYLLFEHESLPEPRIGLDLLRYLVNIWDFLGKQQQKAHYPQYFHWSFTTARRAGGFPHNSETYSQCRKVSSLICPSTATY